MASEEKSSVDYKELRQNRWNLVSGLVWATILLFLLAIWVHVKHWEASTFICICVDILCGVTFLVMAWQLFVLITTRNQEEEQTDNLVKSQKLLGFIVIGLSLLLLVIMVILIFQAGLLSFPEVSSAFVFALVGLGVGLSQVYDGWRNISQEDILNTIDKKKSLISNGFIVLGGAIGLFGIIMGFWSAGWSNWIMLGMFVMILGIILLRSGIWLRLFGEEKIPQSRLRIHVLITGGSIGFLIVFRVLLAILINYQSILGNLDRWKGPEAWRLWLGTYIFLLGLGIMFASLQLAFGEIRRSQTLRRWFFGYNVVFTGVLLLAALVVLNTMCYAFFPYNFNWTSSQGFYSLSDRTKKTLQALEKPTTVFVLMSKNSRDYNDVRNLLDNSQAYSSKLLVQYISPDLDSERYKAVVRKFPKVKISQGRDQVSRGLLLVYGSETEARRPSSFISEEELGGAKISPQGKVTGYEFNGEVLLTRELSFLSAAEQKPTIYFTQSNGEPDIDGMGENSRSMSLLKIVLEKENYNVKRLYFAPPPPGGLSADSKFYSQKKTADPHRLPTDADLIFVAWPTKTFSPEVITALDQFMGRGGKMVVFSNIVGRQFRPIQPGLRGFMKKYGVNMGENFVLKLDRFLPYISRAETNSESRNPVAVEFSKYRYYTYLPRTVKPAVGSPGFTAQTIMEVLPENSTWVETKTDILPDNLPSHLAYLVRTRKIEDIRVRDPISIGVAVKDRKGSPRMVVFGTSYMVTNVPKNLGGSSRGANYYLVVSTCEWLAGREQNIGVPPRTNNFFVLDKGNPTRMVFLPFALMTLGFIGMGIGVWVVRRR